MKSTTLLMTLLGATMPFAQARSLFTRDSSTCPLSGYSRCPDTNLPSNFCCPTDTECISLNNSEAALCCPTGKDCSRIQPIVCDVSQQNATLNPASAIKSTNLTYTMETCSTGCCPIGFGCQDSLCVVLSDTQTNINGTNATGTASTTAASGSGIVIDPVSEDANCPSYPGKAVAAGFFPGMILGALLAVGGIWLWNRHQLQSHQSTHGNSHSRNASNTSAKSTTSFGVHRVRGTGPAVSVSEPIFTEPQTGGTFRTDFLRRVSRMVPGLRDSTISRTDSHHQQPPMEPNNYSRGMHAGHATMFPSNMPSNPPPPIHERSNSDSSTSSGEGDRLRIYADRSITPNLPSSPAPRKPLNQTTNVYGGLIPPPSMNQLRLPASSSRYSAATDGGRTTMSVLLHAEEDLPQGLFSRAGVEPRAL
jgi:hypothetical protein